MNDFTTSSTASVNVTVTKDASGTVTITCAPSTVEIGAFNTLISFHLVSAGYKFKSTGAIVVKVPSPDFPYPSWTMSDTLATLLDKCEIVGTFAYSVFVVDIATGVGYNVDPEIKNGDATCKP